MKDAKLNVSHLIKVVFGMRVSAFIKTTMLGGLESRKMRSCMLI